VLNAAHQKKGRFFWNGRAPSLEDQAGGPLINPKEMGSQKTLEERIDRLTGKKKYEYLFALAFPGEGISLKNVKFAIATFERTLISTGNSPFDRWVQGKNLSPDAIRGWKVFVDKKCSDCHLPPLFSDEEFFNIGVTHRNSNGAPDDGDRSKVTDDDRDKCKFKTPTLRNVSESAPYMHSGSNQTLDRVIQFYSDDPKDQNPCPETVDIRIKEMGKFEKDEKRYLEAFLLSLTDDVSQRKGANLEDFKHKAFAPELPVFEVEPVCRKLGTSC
jgi:cytochrome c peroxidase